MAKPLSASPPLIANVVDKMYHQLVEIHAITAAQLAECAHWHQSSLDGMVACGDGGGGSRRKHVHCDFPPLAIMGNGVG
jgi:hypothetical protein